MENKKNIGIEEKKKLIRGSKNAINRYMLERTVVIAVHDENTITKHGSGILMEVDGQRIVITAAHVIRGIDRRNIQIIASEELSNTRFEPGEGDVWGGSDDEELDVGFLRLSDSTGDLLVGKKFLGISDLDLNPNRTDQDLAILFGMPGEARTEAISGRHSFSSFTYLTDFVREKDSTSNVRDKATISVNYTKTSHDALSETVVELPDPEGMSGGGLWRPRFSEDLIWTPDSLRLVGVLTEIDRDFQEVEANRAIVLNELLSNHFDIPSIY